MAKIVCKILGVLYSLLGLIGLMVGGDANRYHNALHLVTGLMALYFAFWGTPSASKYFCLVFGFGYLVFGIFGFVVGNPAMNYLWDFGLMSVSMADHIHHIVLGAIILAGGILTNNASAKPV